MKCTNGHFPGDAYDRWLEPPEEYWGDDADDGDAAEEDEDDHDCEAEGHAWAPVTYMSTGRTAQVCKHCGEEK